MLNIIDYVHRLFGFPIENSVAMGDPPPREECEVCGGTGRRQGTRKELYATIRKNVYGNHLLTDKEAEKYAKKEILDWREDGKIVCECQDNI